MFKKIISLSAFLLAAGLLSAVAPPQVRGQATAVSPLGTESPPPNSLDLSDRELPSAETLQAQIESVSADDSLDEAFQTRLLTTLRNTLEQLRSVQENRQRQASLSAAAQTAPQRIAEARQRLLEELPPRALPPEVVDQGVLDQGVLDQTVPLYQQRQTEAEANLNAARQELQSLEAMRRDRLIRASAVPMLIADARDAVDQAAAVSIGPLDADPQGILRAARENERMVDLAAARQWLTTLSAEQAAIEAEMDLLPLQIESARKKVQHADETLRLWTEALGTQKQYRIESELAQYREYLQQAGVDVQRSLALTLSEPWRELVSRNAATRRTLARQRSRFDELDSTLKQAQAEITRDLESPHGLRSGLGLKLQRIRSRLPASTDLRSEIRAVDQSIEQTRQLQTMIDLTLEDIRGEYVDGLMFRPNLRLPMDNGAVDSREIDLLKQIETDADGLINDLIELKGQLELNRRKVEDLRALIGRNVIWIRDATPLRVSNLQTAWWTFRWIVHPSHFRAVGSALIVAVLQRIDLVVIWVTLVLVPWGLRPRLLRHLRLLNAAAQVPAEHPLLSTFWALVLTLMLAIPVPIMLAVFGSAMLQVASEDAFLQVFAGALQIAAAAIFPMRWLRQMLRPDGLAEAHFGYARDLTRPANAALRTAIFMSVPFVVLWGLSSSPLVSQGEDTLGRLIFVIAMSSLAAILWRATDPHSGMTSKFLREHPRGWLAGLRHFWHGFSLLPLGFAALSLSGYAYAATLLTERLYWSLWFVIALMVIGGMLTRWVQIRQTNRLISGDPAEHRPSNTAANSGVEPSVDPTIGYAPVEIDAQTLKLLRALLWVTVLVGVAWLWAPVMPAVRFLDGLTLWKTTGIDGAIVPITLAHLVTAVPIIFLTWVAARNVPGLVETAMLERLPLDKPARYAITSLASYTIAIIGIMLTAQTIGLRWEGIQWLVAALGVGLGFGLQEIFANFVSGLILLFEQPIRVGDVVTIGETTGTVSRIRMRATVVTNWDRQELIIPNKNLITERLINWTLSDSINRIELRIGVAYGSDTALACRLLEEICNQHEHVLVDPKPVITFEQFGDSALTLSARCFLGRLDQRLRTTHELNTTIDQRFKEAGIEIAFPQQDLHIRSVPPDWSSACAPGRANPQGEDAEESENLERRGGSVKVT